MEASISECEIVFKSKPREVPSICRAGDCMQVGKYISETTVEFQFKAPSCCSRGNLFVAKKAFVRQKSAGRVAESSGLIK